MKISKKSNFKTIKINNRFICKLYKRIINSLPSYDFSYMNNNVKNLKVSPFFISDIINKKKCTVAYYDCIDNEIKYSRKYKKESLPHEFLHMASTVKLDNGAILSGFSEVITNERKLIGRALNEGYTQILTERYFPESKLETYLLESLICLRLEEVIGKNKMEYLYFKADLPGLIKELINYKTKDEIVYFINSLDFLENAYSKAKLISNIKELQYKYINIVKFLVSIKVEQLKYQLENDPKVELKEYIDLFIVNLYVDGNNKKYKIIDQKILDALYNKYSKKLDSFKAQKTYLK